MQLTGPACEVQNRDWNVMGLLKACSALNLKGGTLLQQPALKETGASGCPNVSHAEVMWARCCRCRSWSSSLLGSKQT